MRARRLVAWLGCVLVCGMGLGLQSAAGEGTDKRMQRVVEQFLKGQPEGVEIVGLGSWIKGDGSYADVLVKGGTSDHDMRLVFRSGTSDAVALKRWRSAQDSLRTLIRAEFGKDANKVLAKTNLYAPSQLMAAVEDSRDAALAFHDMQTVPTLIHEGPVQKGVAAKYSEGLYGKDAKGWIQNYESTKGKAFYRHKNNVYRSSVDVIHATEGHGKFGARSMGHTTMGWIEHAADELKHGDPRAVAKQLGRVDRDLRKGREVLRLGTDDTFAKQVAGLVRELEQPGANLRALSKRIDDVLLHGQLQAAILKRMDDAGPAQRALLKGILRSAERNGRLWKAIAKAARKAGQAGRMAHGAATRLGQAAKLVPVGAILTGLMIAAAGYSVKDTYDKQGLANALAKLLPDLAGLAPGLLAELTEACIQEAKRTGYTMVANGQDPMDLIAGMDTAAGREQPFRRYGRKYEIEDVDQLVRTYHTRAKLEGFVRVRAGQAAARDAGEATAKADEGAAQAIYDRCFPTILARWEEKRDEYRREYIRHLDTLRTAQLVMSYEPNPAVLPEDGKTLAITLQAQFQGLDLGELYGRMRELLRILTVGGIYVDQRTEFTARGKKAAQPMSWRVLADKAKTYKTGVKVEIVCGATKLGDAGLSEQRIQREASVDIVVYPPVAATTGTFKGTYRGQATQGDITIGATGTVQFRIQGTHVVGSIGAYGVRAAMTGTYDPKTRFLRATAKGSGTTTDDKGRVVDRWSLNATIQGTYANGKFTGRYTGRSGTATEAGTWTATGKLMEPAAPGRR